MTNFLSNALKYTFEGSIELGVQLHGQNIEFYVEDTGMGIPEHETQLIFEAFYRGEQAISSAIRGTGLGLNIAKELIELMGGKMGVYSELKMGSRFYFTVPFQYSNLTESSNINTKYPVRGVKDLVILIVDDEPLNYHYLEILLKNNVKKVDIAVNGKQAVEMALKNSYNLVLMDLKMPVMSGIEATRILKAKYPDLPVIAQTAYSLPAEKAYALQAGCDDIIVKPINKAKMMEVINRYG
jgi:CheY-like chemotaxis protein